ncbi:methyltransferase [Armatimonas rosea]|uniref:SAM-dependent methyltransferase n=1 Tax=Armatimonas rosea TaxID=685828 RepID=A0A7W9SMQ5_ARMRO|nr:methyltransferase [Armatimonas rosea]MBB6048803.1 SAM-dependent methyltransferase [Armatimonas rosea]
MSTEIEPSPAAYLSQRIADLGFTQCLLLAVQLGIADLLEDEPLALQVLATATNTHAPSLYRVLRALASRGVFQEEPDGRFALTPLADPLRKRSPQSLHTWALFAGGESERLCWANLEYSVRTGKPAFEHLYGKGWFDYLEEQPEQAKIFNDLMTGGSAADGAAILAAHDFSVYRKIVDVGGGHGALLGQILAQSPQATGVLFDAPSVIAGAHLERAECVGGDFFAAVPEGGDAYVLKYIIHDWDDARARQILQNCRRAMAPGGKVLLVEIVLPPGNTPSQGKFLDLTMMLYFHSRERTEEEYRVLLAEAGLRLVRTTPTTGNFSILEAEAA